MSTQIIYEVDGIYLSYKFNLLSQNLIYLSYCCIFVVTMIVFLELDIIGSKAFVKIKEKLEEPWNGNQNQKYQL